MPAWSGFVTSRWWIALSVALAGMSFGLRLARFEQQVDPPDPFEQAAMQGASGSVLPLSATARPTGEWIARGRVLSGFGGDDQPPGTRITRHWRFTTGCRLSVCTTEFARINRYGQVETAPVRFLNGYLDAAFTLPSDGCPERGAGQLRRAFVISVDPTGRHLQAFEVTAGIYKGCGYNGRDGVIFSTLRWQADQVATQNDQRSASGSPSRRGPSYPSFPAAIFRRSIVAS